MCLEKVYILQPFKPYNKGKLVNPFTLILVLCVKPQRQRVDQ